MNIKKLISILKTKDQKTEVEFIVTDKKGNLVTMELETKTKDMVKLLKMFG